MNNVLYGLPDLGSSFAQPIGIQTGGGGDVYVSGVNVSGNTIYNSSNTGIDLSGYTENATVANNRVYGNGYGIYGYTYSSGVATLSTVSNNAVFDNSTGIFAEGDMLVSQNSIYGQSGDGVSVSGGVYEVLDNTIHDNGVGISCFSNSSALFENNSIYDNSGAGMIVEGSTTAKGNTIYGNTPGILANYGSGAQMDNNLVYDNTTQGILLTGITNSSLVNNTVYQPTGDAIDIQSVSTQTALQNNILWAEAGYDVKVDPTSEVGFQSDYNDLYTTGSGSIGSWEGQTYASLASWILELNVDQHSLSVDPQFVDPAGPDGVLGFSAAPVGPFLTGSGPSLSGTWTSLPASAADSTALAGNGSSTATWTFSGLTPARPTW